MRNREVKLAPGNQSMVFSSLGNISSYESAYFHFYGCTIVGGGPWGNIGDIWGQLLKECQFLEIFPKQNVLSWRAGPGDQLHRRPDPLRPCHRARQEGGCQGDDRSIMMTMSKVRRKGVKVLQNFQELLLFLLFLLHSIFSSFFHLSPGFLLLFAVLTIAFYSTHLATDSLNFASWPPLFSFWPVFLPLIPSL